MRKRLASQTGEIDSSSAREGDTPERIVRSAVLIHSGPNGKEAVLQSMDGDVTFDEERIRDIVQSHNELVSQLALQYGGFDKMPMGAWPPVLDQHADDSNDRIRGRVAGLLRFEVRSVPKVGDKVACAVCDNMTFLGSDTVSQVLDGRIYHLSVGLDEASNTLTEVSTVIEPAAPGAMVFKKRKLKGKPKMNLKLAKLKALQGELKQLSTKASGAKTKMELQKRTSNVTSRFSKLVADKKMTPAELKKVDVSRLSKMSAEDFESLMHVYEARELVVKSGQQGSTAASNFSDVGTKHSEDKEVARLRAAVKKSMKLSGTKFKDKDDEEDEKHLEADDKKDDEKKLEAGDEQVAPGDEVKEDDQVKADIESVMQIVEENTAQIARVASMVDAIIDEMQAPEDEADEDKEDDKDLSADDKKDEDKKDDDDDKKEKKDGDK